MQIYQKSHNILAKAERISKYVKRADIKLAKVTQNIRSGIIKKRGFNPLSKLLGLLAQRLYFQKIEQKGQCTLCYRCVNACPQQAITVFLHSRVKHQYKGPIQSKAE